MNYQNIYNRLIERGQQRTLNCYTEKHHIIPRCLGGSDENSNLVDLTPEEHYVAHQLLCKIYPDNHSLAKAVVMMIPNRPSNKMYGWVKRRFSEAQSKSQTGIGNSQYGTIWITNGIEECKTSGIIPAGWQRGRLSGFLKRKEKSEKKEQLRKEKIAVKQNELRPLLEIYKVYGFDGVKKRGYKHSKPNLVSAFAKYLPEFIPQNGKKRSRVADK